MGNRTSYALGAVTTVAIGAASTQSAVLTNAGVSHAMRSAPFRLVADVDCYIAVGANPTATTSSTALPSGAVEYIDVPTNQKIAVLQKSASGTLNITAVAEQEG